MKNLIIIAGDLAAGKSTLADLLSCELNVLGIKKDEVKEILCDVFDYANREENIKLSIAAVRDMINTFKQTALYGGDLILEANFHAHEMKELYSLSQKHEYNVTLLYLTSTYEKLYERFLSRVPTRHKAHMSIGLDKDYGKFCQYIDTLRNDDYVFEKNVIDTTNLTREEVVQTALKIIQKK